MLLKTEAECNTKRIKHLNEESILSFVLSDLQPLPLSANPLISGLTLRNISLMNALFEKIFEEKNANRNTTILKILFSN